MKCICLVGYWSIIALHELLSYANVAVHSLHGTSVLAVFRILSGSRFCGRRGISNEYINLAYLQWRIYAIEDKRYTI